ncbi:MAG: AIPR family protein, partial [Calditrichota bacterium]
DDVKDITQKSRRARVEFIFIQSKHSEKFSTKEFSTFVNGVRNFLGLRPTMPINEKLKDLHEIKEYVLGNDFLALWDENPVVRMYYVAMGHLHNDNNINALVEQAKRDIRTLRMYTGPEIYLIDGPKLKGICDDNESNFSVTIETIESMPLNAVEGVDNSCIALCSAQEFLKVLRTEEGIIKKSLFDDNVRDYQGPSSINAEMTETIEKEPQNFMLVNNGITIVCNELTQANRKLVLKDPQIVNGCQTSHVVFNSAVAGLDVSQVNLCLRIVSTSNIEIANRIVRGTNRQNIVYDEAFEVTKQYHRDLEDFFGAMASDKAQNQRVFYERRLKQYADNPRIKQTEKVNLRILTQAIIAMFLNTPHEAHRHESVLLRQYANTIYQQQHSRLPYFVAALTFVRLERLFREWKIQRSLSTYKAHLLMLFREHIAGRCPPLHNEKQIDEHSSKVLNVLRKDDATLRAFEFVVGALQRTQVRWVNVLGRSKFAMKDVPEFTSELFHQLEDSDAVSVAVRSHESVPCQGTVIMTSQDINGLWYGFISRSPENIFFHSARNPGLLYHKLKGAFVTYRVQANEHTRRPEAVGVQLVQP